MLANRDQIAAFQMVEQAEHPTRRRASVDAPQLVRPVAAMKRCEREKGSEYVLIHTLGQVFDGRARNRGELVDPRERKSEKMPKLGHINRRADHASLAARGHVLAEQPAARAEDSPFLLRQILYDVLYASRRRSIC